jgi:iron(III) transport system substrate-binding protein
MAALTAALALPATVTAEGAGEGEVNLYSARQENLIKPLLDDFTRDTGIQSTCSPAKPTSCCSASVWRAAILQPMY